MISARMNPRSMSLWILPAACGALVPFSIVQARLSCLAGSEERHQTEQVVDLDDQPVEPAGRDAVVVAKGAGLVLGQAGELRFDLARKRDRAAILAGGVGEDRLHHRPGRRDLRLVDVGDVEHRFQAEQEQLARQRYLGRVGRKRARRTVGLERRRPGYRVRSAAGLAWGWRAPRGPAVRSVSPASQGRQAPFRSRRSRCRAADPACPRRA